MRTFAIMLIALAVVAVIIDVGCTDPTIAAIPTDPTKSGSFTGYGSESVAAASPAPSTKTPTTVDPTVTHYIDDYGQAWTLQTICNGTTCSKEWVRVNATAGPVRAVFNRPLGGFVRRFFGRFRGFRRTAACASC